MRRNHKSFISNLMILLGIFIFISIILNSSSNINQVSTPPDFYATSEEVSIDDFIKYMDSNDKAIFLPVTLPNQFEMTAIYLKKNPFIAIVVYSAESNKDYKSAELTIQISPASSIPTYEDLNSNIQNPDTEKAYEINGWPVLVNEKAYSGGESSFKAKYGDYTVLTSVWIEEHQYLINSPTLELNEVTSLVTSMSFLGN